MAARWLNVYFRFSGKIFHLKQNLIGSKNWYVAGYYAFLLFFTELGLVVVSLPLYIIVSPDKIMAGGVYKIPERPSSMQEYILRRRIGLSSGAGVLAMLFIKFVVIGAVSFLLLGAERLLADTQSWVFTTPSDYTYNTSTIEVTGGVARLRDIGSVISSSTVFSDFATNTAWAYADWADPGSVTVGGTRRNTNGNPTAYVDVDIAITGSNTANRNGAGFWEQSFTTNVSSPDTATLNLDWKSVTYTAPSTPATYRLYAFIDTVSGAPVSTSTAVWNSG